MLDHLIDPDIPTKKEELEYDIAKKRKAINGMENEIEELKDRLICEKSELSDLVVKLHALEPDPDYLRD